VARIGIDYTAAITQGAGIGRYVRGLIGALLALDHDNHYSLFAASPAPLPATPFRVRRVPFHDIWLMRIWHRARLPLPAELITGRVDLFHSPDFTLPPTLPGIPTVLTVHDLSFVRDPDSADDRLRTYLNRVVPRSVRRATHVLADSEATRQDLISLWDTPPDKVTVIYCGVEPHFRPVTEPAGLAAVRARYDLGAGPYIFSVGTLQPRKNYRRLVQAFAPLVARHPDLSLVIAGGRGWKDEDILAEPERLGLGNRVRFPGFVADDDLPALLSAAELFAYPSLYEGFGIPILEAMACGTPVIASDRSSLPEVTGDAGLQVDPLDVTALTAGLERLLTDHEVRTDLIRRGRERAAQFTWPAAARRLLAVYTRLLEGRRLT
jgi:glycosyltransferase involved in cell wall biosynthesis